MTARRNRREPKPDWDNPDFRVGPRWLGLYSDAADPRLFIPRRNPWMGKTINLGHPAARWFWVLMAGGLIVGIVMKLGTSSAP